MAAKMKHPEFCDKSFTSFIYSSTDEMKIIRLQALVRGYLTRRHFHKLRDIYLELFQELEGSSRWEAKFLGTTLCRPQFHKKSKQKDEPVPQAINAINLKTDHELDRLCIVSDEFSDSEKQMGKEQSEISDGKNNSDKITDASSVASETDTATNQKLSDSQKFSEHSLSAASAMRNEMRSLDDQEVSRLVRKPEPGMSDSPAESDGAAAHVSGWIGGQEKDSSRKLVSSSPRASEIVSEDEEKMSGVAAAASESRDVESDNDEAGQEKVTTTEQTGMINEDDAVSDENLDRREHHDLQDVIFNDTLPGNAPSMVHSTPHHDLTTVSRLPPGVDITNQKVYCSESFGDSTSMWDSIQSAEDSEILRHANDPVALEKVRENVALELLWIHQAIDSRKNYLKLKKKLGEQEKVA